MMLAASCCNGRRRRHDIVSHNCSRDRAVPQHYARAIGDDEVFNELVMTSMLRHPNGGVATLDAPSRIDRKKKVMMDARMDARMDDSPVDTAKSWEPHTHLQISINIYKYLPTSTDV